MKGQRDVSALAVEIDPFAPQFQHTCLFPRYEGFPQLAESASRLLTSASSTNSPSREIYNSTRDEPGQPSGAGARRRGVGAGTRDSLADHACKPRRSAGLGVYYLYSLCRRERTILTGPTSTIWSLAWSPDASQVDGQTLGYCHWPGGRRALPAHGPRDLRRLKPPHRPSQIGCWQQQRNCACLGHSDPPSNADPANICRRRLRGALESRRNSSGR